MNGTPPPEWSTSFHNPQTAIDRSSMEYKLDFIKGFKQGLRTSTEALRNNPEFSEYMETIDFISSTMDEAMKEWVDKCHSSEVNSSPSKLSNTQHN